VKTIRFIFFTALIIMAFTPPVLSLETKAVAVPVAEVSAPEFQFESVPEGTKVTHDYIIYNKGSEPLRVLKVRTG